MMYKAPPPFRLFVTRLSCLLLGLLPLITLHAQHLQLTDTRFYCNGHEETFGDIYDVIQTRDGGFAFVGNTIDSGGGILPYCTNLYRRGVMGKLDSNGNILWINNMCNAGIFPKTICETPDGGFAINGGAPATPPLGMLIFRYDRDGNLLWEKNYGRNAKSVTSQIIATPDNGFLMLGYAGNIDSDILVNYHLPPSAFQPDDWVLIKLDSLGNKQWVRTLGTSGDEGYSAAIVTDGRYYYLIGETISKDHDCADTIHYPGPAVSLYTIKLDSAGNVIWSRGNPVMIINKAMFDDRDNSILIAGRCSCKASLFGGGFGNDDMMLMKLDTAANLKWGKLYGSANNENALGLCKTPNNGYLLAGSSYDFKDYNGMLVNVNNKGNEIEQRIIRGGIGGLSYTNVFQSKGGYAALGISYALQLSEGTGTNCPYGTIGSGALVLSRFQSWKAGVTTLSMPPASLILSPNPAHSSLQVSWDRAHNSGILTCTSNSGQMIYHQKVEAGTSSVEISSAACPKGSYTVCWQPKAEAEVCKTIIIN